MDVDETYILLLLSDSNLPTGSFVASGGLESYLKHGFPVPPVSPPPERIINFVRDSLATNARSALPFVTDAHRRVERYVQEMDGRKVEGMEEEEEEEADGTHTVVLGDLIELSELYESMALNHVAKRASATQAVALLSLYSKGLSRPNSFVAYPSIKGARHGNTVGLLVDNFKLKIRTGQVPGHMPICWGFLTAALGLGLFRAQSLYLFLHARGLLSAAVRLNHIGPYAAQQILLHVVQPLVSAEAARSRTLCTGILNNPDNATFDEQTDGPANTWPLGEILSARHDLQHSRIFNS